jgi:hypothetical protein
MAAAASSITVREAGFTGLAPPQISDWTRAARASFRTAGDPPGPQEGAF